MPEIIGSAYVRIKAITDGLNSDIQKGMDKGSSGIDMSSSGEKLGADFGGGVTKGLESEAPNFKKKAAALGDGTDDSGGFTWGQRWAAKAYMGIEKASAGNKNDSFINNLTKGLDKLDDKLKVPRIALLGLFGSPAIGGAINTLGMYVGGLVSQLGYLSTAAVGAAAGIGGAFGLAAAAAGPLLLAFKTQTPALDEFKAKATVFKEIWQDVGESTQKFLLPALTDAMRETTVLVPMFQKFGEQVGAITGGLARNAAGMLTSANTTSALTQILRGSTAVFSQLGMSAVNFSSGLIQLFSAVVPLAMRFADSIKGMSDKFNFFMTVGARSGQLTETLTTWYDRAEKIGTSILNLGKLLWNVFKLAGDAGTPFFDTFEAFTQKWLDFTRSTAGQNQIKKFFEDAVPVTEAVNKLLRDIVSWIVSPIGDDTSGIIRFFDMMRTVVLPAIEKIGAQLSGRLTASLSSFVAAIADFISTTADSSSLSSFFSVLSKILEVLATLLQIPGLGTFISSMLALGGAFKAINLAAKPFLSTIDLISSVFKSKLGAKMFLPVTAAFETFINGTGGMKGVQQAAGSFARAFDPMSLAIGGVTAAITIGIMAFTAWQTNVKRVEQEAAQFTATLLDGGDALTELDKSYKNILKTRESFQDSFDATGFSMAKMTESVNSNVGAWDKFRSVWHDSGETFAGLRANMGGAAADVGEATVKYDEFGRRTIVTGKSIKELDDINKKVPKGIQGIVLELENMVTTGQLTDDEMKEVVDGITDLDKEAIKASASLSVIGKGFAAAGEGARVGAEGMSIFKDIADKDLSLDERNAALQRATALYPQMAQEAGVSMATIRDVSSQVNQEFAGIISKLEELSGKQKSADDAALSHQIALQQLTETFSAAGKQMEGTSTEALQAQQSFRTMSEGGRDAALAFAAVDHSGETSRAKLHELADTMRVLADQEGLGVDQTNELLSSMGLLDDTQINAQVDVAVGKAVADVDELKTQLSTMQGVEEPVKAHIETLLANPGDAGSLLKASQEIDQWKKIIASRQAAAVIRVEGDTEAYNESVVTALGWTKDQNGMVNIDGQTVPYEEAVKVAQEIAAGTTGMMPIDGNIDPATGQVSKLKVHVDETTGKIIVESNTGPATTQTDTWREELPQHGAGKVPVTADMGPADNAVGAWINKWNAAGIPITGEWVGGRGGFYRSATPGGATPPGYPTNGPGGKPLTTTFASNSISGALQATIARGRASASKLLGIGVSSLHAPNATALTPTSYAAANNAYEMDQSNTVSVPNNPLATEPVMHITVKIGDRDITEIVDVQMSGRMGQLATALRRAG